MGLIVHQFNVMGSCHPAVGCTLSLCVIMLAVHVLSVGKSEEKDAPPATSRSPWFLSSLGIFLQHKGKRPTSLREGEGHIVVIMVQRGWHYMVEHSTSSLNE
jgi:hypothetical protein